MQQNEAGAGQIRREDIFNLEFYKKSRFHGSFRGMCYRIEATDGGEGKKQFRVTAWPGPWNFDHTDDDLKETALFPFSEEGLSEVTDYLNQYYAAHREEPL